MHLFIKRNRKQNYIFQTQNIYHYIIVTSQQELFYWIKNCIMNSKNFGLLTKQNFDNLRPSSIKFFSLKKTQNSFRSSERELQTLSFTNSIIQDQKSSQIKTSQPTIQRKTSNFLKSYIEKLKRERKRVIKKKVQLNPRSHNKKQTSIIDNRHESQTLQRQTSILIFKKSQLLDTRGHFYNKLQKYTKDLKFQALLQEIKQLKKKQEQQKEKQEKIEIERNKKKIQKQKSQITRLISIKKYENHLILPNLHNTFYKLPSFSQKNQIEIIQAKRKNDLHQIKSERKPSQRTKQRIQKFYNFKSLEPWENAKENLELHEIVE